MRIIPPVILFLIVLLIPVPLYPFSDGFLEYMTSVQEKVMLRGKRFTVKEAELCWKRFDEEVIALLSKGMITEGRLNRETARRELSVYDQREEDSIELGEIEARFFQVTGAPDNTWLALLSNGMGDFYSSTFHLYQKEGEGYRRLAALEEVKGPWEPERVLSSTIQIQPIFSGSVGRWNQFSSYHSPSLKKTKNNRSQIVWELDASRLRPLLWIPEVDWHMVNGLRVEGRGESYEVAP